MGDRLDRSPAAARAAVGKDTAAMRRQTAPAGDEQGRPCSGTRPARLAAPAAQRLCGFHLRQTEDGHRHPARHAGQGCRHPVNLEQRRDCYQPEALRSPHPRPRCHHTRGRGSEKRSAGRPRVTRPARMPALSWHYNRGNNYRPSAEKYF